MGRPITAYWAGDLFDFKDLTGNIELAAAVEKNFRRQILNQTSPAL